jgi:hypothetical protein
MERESTAVTHAQGGEGAAVVRLAEKGWTWRANVVSFLAFHS